MKIDNFVHSGKQMSKLGNHLWSVARLFELSKNLTVMNIPLDHLNIRYKYGGLSLREMIEHIKSVNNADLKYPIILDEDGEIMDGRHRLMKAILENRKTIKAVRFETNPTPCETTE